jgi:predicted Fe-S protein YdhL (DUF1289 family)
MRAQLTSLNLMSPNQKPKSPCIGVCSSGLGDSVCRGCKRFAHEVIEWNAYSAEQQRAILARISSLLEQVTHRVIEIHDQHKLAEGMRFQNIRFDINASPYVWLLELLKMGAGQITHLEDFGCTLKAEFKNLSMEQLRERIDQDFYVLSQAHYERYFL